MTAPTLKTCITCRHAKKGVQEYFCDLYGRINLVTGAYGLAFCELVRADDNRCGPEGRMWKPIEQAEVA